MSYISEEAVKAAADEAATAQQEADDIAQSPPRDTTGAGDADWHRNYAEASAKATRLQIRAAGLAAQRSRYEAQLAARKATVARMKDELAIMRETIQADAALLNEAAQNLATSLVRLQTVATRRNGHLAEFASRLAGAGLLAQSLPELSEGEHHPSGASPQGSRGTALYLANELYETTFPEAIAFWAVGAVFGRPGGTGSERLAYQISRDVRTRGRLDVSSDFVLPSLNAPASTKPTNGHTSNDPARTSSGRFARKETE